MSKPKLELFRFRAECAHDVAEFIKIMPFEFEASILRPGLMPDVTVSLLTTATLSEIKEAMRAVPDSHVMLETLQLGHLYSGERVPE